MGPLIRLDLGYEANFLYFILDVCSIHKGDDMNNNLENLSSTDTVHTGLFFMSHSLPLANTLPHLPYFLDLQMLGEFQKRSHFPNNLISKKREAQFSEHLNDFALRGHRSSRNHFHLD